MSMMAGLAKLVVPRIKQLFYVIFFFLILSISPLMLAFYLLCWIRAKLTALVYSNVNTTSMSGYDTVAGLEFNANNNIINCIMIVNSHFSVEEVKDLTMSNVINPKDRNNKPLFPKLTRCLALRAGYFVWSEKNNFDIDDHIRPFHGQPPLDEAELKSVVNHLCNTPLNLSKPPWEIHVIPTEYRQTNVRQTCLLLRVHHSIADGFSLLRLLIEQLGGNHGAFQHILKRMQNKLQPNFRYEFVVVLGRLKQMMYTALNTSTIIYEQMLSKDRRHPHNRKLTGINIFDWTSAIKMSTIKDIKNATYTTVNDVIVSCLAGACRKYLLRQGVHPPDFLRSVLPITFHHADGPIQLKNGSMAVVHQLPTGDMDCVQRLKSTKSIMDELKRSPDIFIIRWFIKHCANTVPYSLMKWLYDSAGFHVIYSNVPGPMNTVLFNGRVVDSCIGLAQMRSSCYFGLAALSYAGNLTVGLTVDTAIINTKEEAGLVLRDFVQEVQSLYHSVIPTQSPIEDKYFNLN